jgi:hypothetical protein
MKRYLAFGAAGLVFFCSCRQMNKLRLPEWRSQPGEYAPFTLVGPQFAASSPALLRLKAGDLALAFKGPGKSPAVREKSVFFTRSADGGNTWSNPKPVLTGVRTFENPSLFQLPEGRLILTYGWGAGAADRSGITSDGFFVSSSYDGGVSFTAPRFIRPPGADWVETGGEMLALDDGTLLAPLTAGKRTGGTEVLLAVSRDGGEKWEKFLTVSKDSLGARSFRKPALVRLPDRRLLCLLERGDEDPYLYETRSADDGVTWEKPRQTGVQGRSPELAVTPRGTLVCAFNDLWPAGVSLIRSYDRGISWEGENQLLDSLQPDPSPRLAVLPKDALLAAFEDEDPDGKPVIRGIRFDDGPPAAPAGFSGSFKPDRSIHLRWNSVKGAAYYIVFRDPASTSVSKTDTGFASMRRGTSVTPRFIDRQVDTLKTYRYRVSAVRTFGRPVEGAGSMGDPSPAISVKYR